MPVDFQIKTDVPVPAAAFAAKGHSFPFAQMQEALKADPSTRPHITVPKEYWTEDRGLDEKAATADKSRNRILNAFKTWRDGEPSREGLMLLTRADVKTGSVGCWLQYQPGYAPNEGGNGAATETDTGPATVETKKGGKK